MATPQTPAFPPLGMSPAVWGPIFWTTMHIVSLGYSQTPTPQERDAAVQFFESLKYTIPCPICRTHYSAFLETMPVRKAVTSRNDLVFWVFTLHNAVNTKLDKPAITFDQFVQHMQDLAAQSYTRLPSQTALSSNAGYIALGGIVGITGYYLYNKYIK